MFGRRPKHASVRIEPNSCPALFRVTDHVDQVRMQHRFSASGAAHPRTKLTALVCNAFPQLDREQLAFALAIKLSNL
jgi:hypothetical protein